MLPNFLGIGAQKSGTTWLDAQLRAHRDIFLPTQRKEIHFFDRYYDRGIGWYQQFFVDKDQSTVPRAVGEITPRYLYDANAPGRIRECLPDCKLIAILRNPVDRAYSHYNMQIQNQFEQRSFLRFLGEDPEAFRRGLYYVQFRRYLDHFERDKLLVLVFEVAMRQPRTELSRVADFLSIDPGGFSECPQGRRIGASHRPRFPYARSVAVRARKALRDKDMDWVINLSAKLGIPRLFGDHGAPPPMASADRGVLRQRYEPSIRALEALLALDLTVWRQ